jgi:S-DNA-T family DNA segregation ATPase FtsK/SpoIIIE
MRDRSQLGAARSSKPDRQLIPLQLEPRRQRLHYEAAGLGLFTFGLLMLIGLASDTGFLGACFHRGLAFLVGVVGAPVVACALMLLGAAMVLRWERIEFLRIGTGFAILLWTFLAMLELAIAGRSGVPGFASQPGGLLGAGLAAILRPLLGRTVGFVVLALGALCAVGYTTDTPIVHILGGAGRFALAAMKTVVRPLGRLRFRRPRPQTQVPAAAPPRRARRPVPPPGGTPTPKPKAEPEPPARQPRQPQLQLLVSEPGSDVEPESGSAAAAPTETAEAEGEPYGDYQLPPLSLLSPPPSPEQSERDTIATAKRLEAALASYGIEARVVDIERGPRVTRYEIQLPPGVRVSRVTGLADDLALTLKALAVRIEAPVPGKGVIGIEIPNPEVTFVHLLEILESPVADRASSKVAFALGRDISGHPMMADLGTMPHLLIAGTTNSGKSVCLNALIATLLLRARPDEVKLLLIDPKRVELSLFEGIPHLVAPVAHDAKEAAGLLRWAIREMELRYNQFADLGVRNIHGWNQRAQEDPDIEPMYFLIIVIDELADLMMQAATEFETSVCRLAQLARATGIHLVVATQRPSVNVITGTIKANIPSRIAFAVATQVDSRTILDINGAESLVGSGDMLYLPLDSPTGKPVRIQGAYVSERDVVALTEFLKQQAKPTYATAALESIGTVSGIGKESDLDDPMFQMALDFVLATRHASASMLQRKFKLGYTRAARLIDMMEARGYIGPADGRRAREVYGAPGDHIARRDHPPADRDPSDDYQSEDDEDPDHPDDE